MRHTRKGEAVRVFKDGVSQKVYVRDTPRILSLQTFGETSTIARISRVRDYLVSGFHNAKTEFAFRWYWNGLLTFEEAQVRG